MISPWHFGLFAVFSFILGACIGSFLNVCIYRMPREMSVHQPRRSFCPSCNKPIEWRHNLPLVSWLWLRGKCAYCGAKISPRYLAVEFLTASLFLAVFVRCPPALWLPYWVFVSLLIVATFIDFDFYIIPDEITIGGTVAGMLLSAGLPVMMQAESHWKALGWSALGAAAGFVLLWGVVELGKLAFGKKKIVFPRPQPFRIVERDDQPVLTVNGDSFPWADLFFRPKDRLMLTVESASVNRKTLAQTELVFFHDRLEAGGRMWPLAEVDEVTGVVREIVIPREAMGFGDVKFIATIGAFLGWKAVLFVVPVAAVFGSVIGIGSILVGKREWSAKIPFGPYLTAGAVLWIFAGPELVGWYLGLMRR
ncbi:MAG TPA: prepilin peptidase [Chthoniobacterales bacterium]